VFQFSIFDCRLQNEFIFDVRDTSRWGQPFGGYNTDDAVFHVPVTCFGLDEFPNVGGVHGRYSFKLSHDFGTKLLFHFDLILKKLEMSFENKNINCYAAFGKYGR
jgi:hypothetical protein